MILSRVDRMRFALSERAVNGPCFAEFGHPGVGLVRLCTSRFSRSGWANALRWAVERLKPSCPRIGEWPVSAEEGPFGRAQAQVDAGRPRLDILGCSALRSRAGELRVQRLAQVGCKDVWPAGEIRRRTDCKSMMDVG